METGSVEESRHGLREGCESLLSRWCWFLRVKFLSPDPGKTSLLAPVSHPGVSVTSDRRFTGDEEKTWFDTETQ